MKQYVYHCAHLELGQLIKVKKTSSIFLNVYYNEYVLGTMNLGSNTKNLNITVEARTHAIYLGPQIVVDKWAHASVESEFLAPFFLVKGCICIIEPHLIVRI